MNKNIVRIGCGAGYQGDRCPPAVTLVENGKLDYMILECLAERTLTDSIRRMKNDQVGYDPRLNEWLTNLLPVAQKNNVTIITNMGAADPKGAGEEAFEIAKSLNLRNIRIVIVSEVTATNPYNTQVTSTFHDTTILNTKNVCNTSGPRKLRKSNNSSSGFSVHSDDNSDSIEEDWEFGCTYLGADSIIDALKLGANLVIAGRVADPSLFVAPIAYTFGWDLKKDFGLIAQATLAGHLLECGCHLTGGYFAHPLGRNLEFSSLSNLSLPFCDIDRDGNMVLGKLDGSGGELSERTCKQQLTYEISNPSEYITPDIIVDFSQVRFHQLSENSIIAQGAKGSTRPDSLLKLVARQAGFKSWAEVSYGGLGCVERAQWAYKLVDKWMEARKPGSMKNVIVYLVGYNSLYLPHGSSFNYLPNSIPNTFSETNNNSSNSSIGNWISGYPPEVRLRFDGLFENKQDAEALGLELQGLGLCGPAGGGGFATGIKKDVRLIRQFIQRDQIKWNIHIFTNNNNNNNTTTTTYNIIEKPQNYYDNEFLTRNGFKIKYQTPKRIINLIPHSSVNTNIGGKVLLYNIAHSRSGDKGDTANVSLIPYQERDYDRLVKVITKDWVYKVYKNLLKENFEIHIYHLPGIHSLNIVLNFALDGGVCISRRIDRHGKTLSDLILNQWIDLPPISNL